MGRTTPWLWLALAGAALTVGALNVDFYLYQGERQGAWFGIPQTSELIFLAAVVALVLFLATFTGRNPLGGRRLGLTIAVVGLLATLQLGYRMIVPPFGSETPEHVGIIGVGCMYYCLPSDAVAVELLPGMWAALIGVVAITAGGLLHALSRTARETAATPWIAAGQPGMTPWLGLAGLGAAGQFVFGYTMFTFYETVGRRGATTWSGWLTTPHTGWVVMLLTLAVIGLVWLAARRRAPLSPARFGLLIAALGLVSTAAIGYRIMKPPFGGSTISTEIGMGAYLAVLAAALILASGAIHALTAGSGGMRTDAVPT